MTVNNAQKTTKERLALDDAAKQLEQQRRDLRTQLNAPMKRLLRLARRSP